MEIKIIYTLIMVLIYFAFGKCFILWLLLLLLFLKGEGTVYSFKWYTEMDRTNYLKYLFTWREQRRWLGRAKQK